MIVTAEPYFAVRLPSEIVILESETRENTKGKLFPVNEYKLMKRSQYEKLWNTLAMTPISSISHWSCMKLATQ